MSRQSTRPLTKELREGSISRAGFSERAKHVGTRWRTESAPSGLFIGIVQDDYDDQKMGRLKVYIPNFSINSPRTEQAPETSDEFKSVVVMPIFPFFGSSDYSKDKDGFSQSYGFWAQPRVGDHVAVMFANSEIADGYYIGCVPKYYQNFQVPGVPVDKIEGEDFSLPGSESPKNEVPGKRKLDNVYSENLKRAGLQDDEIRGGGFSGATRESPSRVIGLKSPGDRDTKQIGHQFVMDDHPEHQGMRLRSSKGNQVLISDVGGVIYISSAKGETWMEIREDGHIDVYASKSVSIHAEEDLNLDVDRDLNLNVGRDVNFSIGGSIKGQIGENYDCTISGDFATTINGKEDRQVEGDSLETIGGSSHTNVLGSYYMRAASEAHISSQATMKIHSNSLLKEQEGASSPSPAIAAVKPQVVEVPGPPSTAQVSKAKGGDKVEKVGGRDSNVRVPQHEPWHPNGVEKKSDEGGQSASSKLRSPRTDSPPANSSDIKYLVVHCSATKPDQDIGAKEIDQYHKSRGWRMIGYHLVIRRNGAVEPGRPLDMVGAHVKNHNIGSIGVCIVGGLHSKETRNGKPIPYPEFEEVQFKSLRTELESLLKLYPNAKVVGHRDFVRGTPDDKACPTFKVPHWWETGEVVPDVDGAEKQVDGTKKTAAPGELDPYGKLPYVHPDLQAVLTKAYNEGEVKFQITSGWRSASSQDSLYAGGARPQGQTKPKNSRHLYGLAVDLLPLDPDTGMRTYDYMGQVVSEIKSAASSLGISIEWGGEFNNPDVVHWQLPRSSYADSSNPNNPDNIG